MEYPDLLLTLLVDIMKPGTHKVIADIAKCPEKFVETVKYLFDGGWISTKEYEFNHDYTIIKRLDY